MPSVLAQDIPLLTLQAKNIQVRAEWEKVGDAGNHFRLDGGTLVLTSTISGAGKPEGNAITVIVKVRDKFSTLNPSYKDLAVMVTIRAVIMGCRAEETRYFAKSRTRYIDGSEPPNQIIMREKEDIAKGDVLAHRYTENGFNHIYLYTVSATHGDIFGKPYLTAEPTSFTELTEPSLYDNLNWDYGPDSVPGSEWTELGVNESEDCFAEEVETFKYNLAVLKYNNTPVTGLYAGTGARAISVVASVSNNRQIFSLDDVLLANVLNERYTIKVINDDGKAFSIDGKRQNGDRYEYYANLTAVSDGVENNSPHEVIIFNGDCPQIYTVTAWQEGAYLRISVSDFDKVRKYVIIEGTIYTDADGGTYAGVSAIKGVESNLLNTSSFIGFASGLDEGDYPIKFADHFICESI